jgi:hypothetical protein
MRFIETLANGYAAGKKKIYSASKLSGLIMFFPSGV